MNRAYVKSNIEIEQMRDLAEEAMLAQIDFKVQVQEWKNILLRGDVPEEKELHLAAFLGRAESVKWHFTLLEDKAKRLELGGYASLADSLRGKHAKLTAEYLNMLETHPRLDPGTAREIDRKVKGMDRGLEKDVTELGDQISENAKTQRDVLIKGLSERYITLRKTLLIVIAFFIALVTFNLYSTLRGLSA